jgi:hypothetical protein
VTAYDTVSGSITPVVNPVGPYTSGRHTLTWTATDAAGNRKSATQTVTVKPQASLAINQTVGEGSDVTVNVFLSGAAAVYPVTIPFAVRGSATNPADHNAANGVITFNSGTTGKLFFHTVDDGFNGEANETMVIDIQTSTNAVLGARRSHTVTLIEGNVAPLVDIDVEQQGALARVVFTDKGLMRHHVEIRMVTASLMPTKEPVIRTRTAYRISWMPLMTLPSYKASRRYLTVPCWSLSQALACGWVGRHWPPGITVPAFRCGISKCMPPKRVAVSAQLRMATWYIRVACMILRLFACPSAVSQHVW